MRKILLPALLLAATTPPLRAESWSLGVGTGPFVFGYFVQRTTQVNTDAGSGTVRSRLSAATRPGGSADIEREINDWLGVRLDAAWTRAPMKVKSGGQGVAFDAGTANITTVALPLVFNVNRHGVSYPPRGRPGVRAVRHEGTGGRRRDTIAVRRLARAVGRRSGRGAGVVDEQPLRAGG